MDLIDKKLEKRGFIIQNHGSYSAGYYKILYDSAGLDTGKGQFVEIVQDFGVGRPIYIQSSIKGVGCGGGRSCTYPLSLSEFRLFYVKSRILAVNWWLKWRWEELVRRFKRGILK